MKLALVSRFRSLSASVPALGLVLVLGGCFGMSSKSSSDADVQAASAPPQYTVTPSMSQVTLTPSAAQTVASGGTVAFTAVAAVGYALVQKTGGSCPAGAWNAAGTIYTTGAIVADCTVAFSATPLIYTVTPGGTNVTLSPNAAQTVPYQGTQSFSVAALTGYRLSTAVGGTCPVGSWTTAGAVYQTGKIIADCTVAFSATLATFTVTSSGTHVSILPSGAQSVNYQSTLALTVTASTGYALSSTVTGTCPQGSWSSTGGVYTTGPVVGDCTVAFSATIETFTVSASGTGLTISPSAAQTVDYGSSVIYTVSAKSGYVVSSSVTGTCPPGVWTTPGSIYQTAEITQNCTVVFSELPDCQGSGTLDLGFGQSGVLDLSQFGSFGGAIPTQFVVTPAGKIILGGATVSSPIYPVVYQLTSSGSLDGTNFGSSGSTTLSAVGANSVLYGLTLQSNGQIVGAGDFNQDAGIFVTRLNATGAIDTHFGTNGITKVSGDRYATSPVVVSDGSIWVIAQRGVYHFSKAGAYLGRVAASPFGFLNRMVSASGGTELLIVGQDGSNQQALVMRMSSAGVIDKKGFGSSGVVTLKASGIAAQGEGIDVMPSGDILVSGWWSAAGSAIRGYFLAELDGAGALVSKFGNDGMVTDTTAGAADSVRYSSKGILMGGYFDGGKSGLARFLETGTIDNAFGTDGFNQSTSGAGCSQWDVEVQPDGRILRGGACGSQTTLIRVCP